MKRIWWLACVCWHKLLAFKVNLSQNKYAWACVTVSLAVRRLDHDDGSVA